MNKLLFIHGNFFGLEQAKESLDMALAAASLEFSVSLLFMNDGVFQLIGPEDSGLSGVLKALPFYDIQNIYVMQESLEQRKLLSQDLVIPTMCVSCHEIVALFNAYDVVC